MSILQDWRDSNIKLQIYEHRWRIAKVREQFKIFGSIPHTYFPVHDDGSGYRWRLAFAETTHVPQIDIVSLSEKSPIKARCRIEILGADGETKFEHEEALADYHRNENHRVELYQHSLGRYLSAGSLNIYCQMTVVSQETNNGDGKLKPKPKDESKQSSDLCVHRIAYGSLQNLFEVSQ